MVDSCTIWEMELSKETWTGPSLVSKFCCIALASIFITGNLLCKSSYSTSRSTTSANL